MSTRTRSVDDSQVLTCADAGAWESWLGDHHEGSGGVWLRIAKKGSDDVSVTIREALDAALCFGWIDSQRRSDDADHYLQRYSPRRPRSPWSKRNADRAEELADAGRMRAPGLAEIAAAKQDGRWAAAYESQRDATPPPDLVAALEVNDPAAAAFAQLDRTARYLIILPLLKAATPETRERRLRKAITQLEARGAFDD